MDTIIREYTPTDKPDLLTIIRQNVPRFFAESEINDLDAYLDTQIEKYFVVEWGGNVIGAGGINFEDDHHTGIISWDLIAPEFQGCGIGTKLLGHRLELLKSMDSIKIILVRTSQLTYAFYEKNGFVLKEVRKDYWSKGFDMYKMIYE